MSVDWSKINHFSAREFSSPGNILHDLVLRLDQARSIAGVPIYITSSFRHGDDGVHGDSNSDGVIDDGGAADISDNLKGESIASRWRYKVMPALYAVGFRRIGDYDRHIHVDISTSRPLDVAWWGKSK